DSLWESVFLHFLPCGPAVGRMIQSAARPAALHAPRRPLRLPQRSKQNDGIAGIERNVDAARLRVFIQHLLPSLAAATSTEASGLLFIPNRMSQRCDESDLWILRVDNQPPDGMRVPQADEVPRLARAHGFVHAVSAHDVAANARFPCTDINHV